jgi:hypothetical protein
MNHKNRSHNSYSLDSGINSSYWICSCDEKSRAKGATSLKEINSSSVPGYKSVISVIDFLAKIDPNAS